MAEGGFITNWRRLEEKVSLVIKQHYVEARRLGTKIKIILMIAMKILIITLSTSILLSFSKNKTIDKDILKKLMKDIEGRNKCLKKKYKVMHLTTW